MNLDLNKITKNIRQNELVKSFIKELSKALENFNNQNEIKGEKMDDINLNHEEDLEFHKKKMEFLENFFEKELSNLSNGEIFLVTDKYENDDELHRYKVAQYKNHMECKYVTFEKDLPENIKVGDVVRKIDNSYIYDETATQYVSDMLKQLKEQINS